MYMSIISRYTHMYDMLHAIYIYIDTHTHTHTGARSPGSRRTTTQRGDSGEKCTLIHASTTCTYYYYTYIHICTSICIKIEQYVANEEYT